MSHDAPLRQLPQEYVAEFPLSQLEPYPGNPKEHDHGVLDESLTENGWYGAIVAQRRKWKDGGKAKARVIAGHGRFDRLRERGVSHAPVLVVDCDDETARRIVLVDNESSRKGGFNNALLHDFLKPLAELGQLAGTGYDGDDVDDLAALLQPFDFGAPKPVAEAEHPYKAHETIVVHVKKVEHMTAATAAVAKLLAENPEWEAAVHAR